MMRQCASRNNWRLAERNFEEALRNLPAGEDATKKELLFQLAKGCADAGDLARAVEFALELANLLGDRSAERGPGASGFCRPSFVRVLRVVRLPDFFWRVM